MSSTRQPTKRFLRRIGEALSAVMGVLGLGRTRIDSRDVDRVQASRETMKILRLISSDTDTIGYADKRIRTLDRMRKEQDVLLRKQGDR